MQNYFVKEASWRLKFAWRPHRCMLSGKWIWLELGYQGRAIWFGKGLIVPESWTNTKTGIEIHWLTKEEFLEFAENIK